MLSGREGLISFNSFLISFKILGLNFFLFLLIFSSNVNAKPIPPGAGDGDVAANDKPAMGENAAEERIRQEKLVEARQGHDLWRSINRVVSLSVNVRAPGILSRLQGEMRSGKISDEMWELYMSRRMTPQDPRLSDPEVVVKAWRM